MATYFPFLFTLVLAGCTTQVVKSSAAHPASSPQQATAPVGSPAVTAVAARPITTPQPEATQQPQPSGNVSMPMFDMQGSWTDVPENGTTPVQPSPCTNYTRYIFTADAATCAIDVLGPPQRFGAFTGSLARDKAHEQTGEILLVGTTTGPGPDDGPRTENTTYRLHADVKRGMLVGTQQTGHANTLPIALGRLVAPVSSSACP
jgi:hypothetical protein